MKWANLILALAISSTGIAGGILPCMVKRRGLTNEQIDGILARHPDAQLRISAQDWRGMRYQLARFHNDTTTSSMASRAPEASARVWRVP